MIHSKLKMVNTICPAPLLENCLTLRAPSCSPLEPCCSPPEARLTLLRNATSTDFGSKFWGSLRKKMIPGDWCKGCCSQLVPRPVASQRASFSTSHRLSRWLVQRLLLSHSWYQDLLLASWLLFFARWAQTVIAARKSQMQNGARLAVTIRRTSNLDSEI